MKKDMIIRRISQILLMFFVYFALGIMFAYFRGDEVNVPEELIDTAVFCVAYFVISNFWDSKKKTDSADNNSVDTE